MGRIINLKESSFRRLFEYVGDEEALGRYDISDNGYIPDEEKDSIIDKKTHDTEFILDFEDNEPEYIGQELNDPGPYADYKTYDYNN